MATFPPPWEAGPGPADPNLSGTFGSYTGSGYGPVGQGTLGVGNPIVTGSQFPPAQARLYIQGNNLYILDNVTGNSYFVSLSGVSPVPGNYAKT